MIETTETAHHQRASYEGKVYNVYPNDRKPYQLITTHNFFANCNFDCNCSGCHGESGTSSSHFSLHEEVAMGTLEAGDSIRHWVW
jgi:hypothetical protein